MSGPWTVPATVVGVLDEATLLLRLELGWHITLTARCKLAGLRVLDETTDQQRAARAFIADLLGRAGGALDGSGAAVTFISHEIDQRGHTLGQVIAVTPQGETLDIGYELHAADLAVLT